MLTTMGEGGEGGKFFSGAHLKAFVKITVKGGIVAHIQAQEGVGIVIDLLPVGGIYLPPFSECVPFTIVCEVSRVDRGIGAEKVVEIDLLSPSFSAVVIQHGGQVTVVVDCPEIAVVYNVVMTSQVA
ncbi:hypothetical protein ES703_85388 [subsurface metagenome]